VQESRQALAGALCTEHLETAWRRHLSFPAGKFSAHQLCTLFRRRAIFSGDFRHRRGVRVSTSDSNSPAHLLLSLVALLLAVLGNVDINRMSTDFFPATNALE
jgi:hypothetical protein